MNFKFHLEKNKFNINMIFLNILRSFNIKKIDIYKVYFNDILIFTLDILEVYIAFESVPSTKTGTS